MHGYPLGLWLDIIKDIRNFILTLRDEIANIWIFVHKLTRGHGLRLLSSA